MKSYTECANNLMDILGQCTCQYTTVSYAKSTLLENGFKELKLEKDFEIERGGKYFVNLYESGLIAWVIGEEFDLNGTTRIIASHTDHPCIYVKPNPEMQKGNYASLNVEMYGGMILNTWLDRPLSLAGKITYKSEEVYKPNVKVIDFEKSLFTIPNLAIHQNREVNKGIELKKQGDMIPVCGMIKDILEKDNYFIKMLADKIGVKQTDILDYDMYIYNHDIPEIIGINDDFISSPRLDNITSVAACIDGIKKTDNPDNISVIVLFDNEEIGSGTKQGADSAVLSQVLERIYDKLGYTRTEFLRNVSDGFFVSMDVAHGEHPNNLAKSDVTNKNPLGQGLVIKRACSQTYATDSASIAIIEQLCQKNDIPYQKFSSNNNMTTGSTLGRFVSRYLPMKMADIGVPVLAMHSAREMMGTKDQLSLNMMAEAFFNEI